MAAPRQITRDHVRQATPRETLVGDLSGGVSSGVVSITGNAAAGIIAFGPLGPEYLGMGILAAMFASIVGGAVGAGARGTPGMIAGPRATTAMLFAALLTQLIATGDFDISRSSGVTALLALGFLAVFFSGVIQASLGVFRIGGLVRFIPYPVVAGIRNAAAILLIKAQIWPYLGIDRGPFVELFGRIGDTQPLTVLVATITALIAWQGSRVLPKSSVPAVALVVGAGLHHALAALAPGGELGPLLGALPSAIPTPGFAAAIGATLVATDWFRYLPLVLSGAAAMAILDAISALINLVALQSMSGHRVDASRQLISQGAGNIASAAFGGLPASGIFARIAINHRSGGRTRMSSLFNSATILLLLVVLAGPLGLLPHSAIAGLIVVIAAGLFDRWTFDLFREVKAARGNANRDALINLLVMASVVTVGLGVSLVAAVAAGVVASILIFVAQMSRSPIRRARTGHTVRSKTRRDEHRTEVLNEYADRIAHVELEGTIFFGSADSIAAAVDELAEKGVDFIVLDLKRVRRIDVSGYRVLSQSFERLKKIGVRLGFSYVNVIESDEIVRNLQTNGPVDRWHMFETTDDALEAFEDRMLLALGATVVEMFRWSSAEVARSLGLNEEQAPVFAGYLMERSYADGEFVCRQGDPGDSMFFVSRGAVDVSIEIPRQDRRRRLATLTQGTLFGEMSLLDHEPRSADVQAKEDLTCYELRVDRFNGLAAARPDIAITVYAAIGISLGSRLRDTHELIGDLDA